MRLRSSTSLANFLIVDRMLSDGPCSSDDVVLVWRYSFCARLIMCSGSIAWMDNLFRMSMALSRVLCRVTRHSACVCGSLFLGAWGGQVFSTSSPQLGLDVLIPVCSSISWSTSKSVSALGGLGAATGVVGVPHLLLELEGGGGSVR